MTVKTDCAVARTDKVSILSLCCPVQKPRPALRPAMLQICAYASGAVYCLSEIHAGDTDGKPPRTYLRTRMIATPLSARQRI